MVISSFTFLTVSSSPQLAEPLRCMLHYTGTAFEDKQYDIVGEAPNFSRAKWEADKFNLGLEFPNASWPTFCCMSVESA